MIQPNSRPTRVAFASHTSALTGAAMSFYTLLSGLDSQSFRCYPVLPEKGPMFDRLVEDAYQPFTVRFKGVSKFFAKNAAKKYLKAQGIELVYLSCAHKFTRMLGKAAYELNIPVVWHVREPPKGNRVQKSIPFMKKFGAKVVVVSQEQKDVLAPKLDVFKVDNGVDIARFHSRVDGNSIKEQYNIDADSFTFGIIGTIEKRKNTENFLKAAQVIAPNYPHAKFLVIGAGSDEFVTKMKNLVAQTPELKKATTFTGNVWNVPEMIAALDVVVMPSSWEAFPRVVIESMMMKKAVIASDVGDVSYIIDDGKNGIVVPSKDLEQLTKAMELAVSQPEHVLKLAEEAELKAKRNFTQEIHVSRMESIFKQALA